MKKIKFKAILTNISVGINPKMNLESMDFRITTYVSKKEIAFLKNSLVEGKELQISIKNVTDNSKQKT
jgi:hypothetical protein